MKTDDQFVARLLDRDRPGIARAISMVEAGGEAARRLLDNIYPRTGRAYRVGITGPPGAGKSTLAGEIARTLRQSGHTIAIVAVDPTSPFTSGALLGDRVRMADLDNDEDVFIRSMATRGTGGGLGASTADAADIFDAAGFDYIFIESAGVGQTELDVRHLVDTTVVVLAPEAGDQVQAAKAGLMEIADIFVMNKCDRPGSGTAMQSIQSALSFRNHGSEHWQTRIIETVASESRGAAELVEEILRHKTCLQTTNKHAELLQKRVERRLRGSIRHAVDRQVWSSENEQCLEDALPQILSGKLAPADVVAQICTNITAPGKTDE
ncbi:MAG: methylmalonyl Co-A mutase-associated GTPase MeaB [Gammaproteobacteria bacterium]|nr:methylmalonyl Co-A mutase-associated GTPase MeaB [Gammaproteobacteria bacterium]MDE0283756.1 methylmalonyl Co-A mutase-associated GTPase MeaB [Gammaproteobacteria bacterium]